MAKRRVPGSPNTAAKRRLLFQTWQQTGNVTLACRSARVGRRTFYYRKPRFDAGGYDALDTVQSSIPKRIHQASSTVVEHVLALRRAHPTWGKKRIAQQLASAQLGSS